jgi:hypothetical protein
MKLKVADSLYRCADILGVVFILDTLYGRSLSHIHPGAEHGLKPQHEKKGGRGDTQYHGYIAVSSEKTGEYDEGRLTGRPGQLFQRSGALSDLVSPVGLDDFSGIQLEVFRVGTQETDKIGVSRKFVEILLFKGFNKHGRNVCIARNILDAYLLGFTGST